MAGRASWSPRCCSGQVLSVGVGGSDGQRLVGTVIVLIFSKSAFAGTHKGARDGRLLRSHDTHATRRVLRTPPETRHQQVSDRTQHSADYDGTPLRQCAGLELLLAVQSHSGAPFCSLPNLLSAPPGAAVMSCVGRVRPLRGR
jgi:hypothetical protein